MIALSDAFQDFGRDLSRKSGRKTLINDRNFAFIDTAKLDDIALRTLADGDDMVGLANGLAELPSIDFRVEPMVEFGMAQENQVVDGYDAANTAFSDADGQFTRQSVIELHAVAPQVADNAACAPIEAWSVECEV